MLLSVIVTSYNSPETLLECLSSLVKQPAAGEIVVADCSPELPAELQSRFPNIRLLHFPERTRVPRMRWTALRETRGEIVAAVEARCVPSENWCQILVDAHQKHPEAPAIGGPVSLRPDSAISEGLYFAEYGLYAPPLTEGPAHEISGANLSYKRRFLNDSRDLLDAGHWETHLHLRWVAAGHMLWMSQAAVRFQNSMQPGTILRQRFHYGRGYGAARFTASGPRLLHAAMTPLLPCVLTLRLARSAFAKGMGRRFLRAVGWTFLFESAWSLGEAIGYLFGASSSDEVF